MKKATLNTGEKVYAAAKKLFKPGKTLSTTRIAKHIHMSVEGTRAHILKLVAKGKIQRHPVTSLITKVK